MSNLSQIMRHINRRGMSDPFDMLLMMLNSTPVSFKTLRWVVENSDSEGHKLCTCKGES